MYILDEPTIGLHYEDIDKLMGVIYKLRESGSTVVIIEHNLEIINASDYIIDLGPDGGSAGGFLTFQGLKKDFVLSKNSQTSKFLNTHINELTAKYEKIYNENMSELGVLGPDIQPRATDHIKEMIELIDKLVNQNNAYVADNHVLFDVSSYEITFLCLQ